MSRRDPSKATLLRQRPSLMHLLLLLVLTITLASAENAKASAGYLTPGLSDINYKDGRIAFSMWMKELSATEKIDIDVKFYDSVSKVMEEYSASRLELVGVNPIYYLSDIKRYDAMTDHFWAAQRGKERLEKAVLLVRRKSKIESLAALEGKVIISREDNVLGRVFLEKTLFEERNIGSKAFFKEMQMTGKNSTAILKTYFGKADACVVPEFAFKTASEMNPAIKKELKVLKESPRLFTSVLLLTRKGTDEKLYRAFSRSAASLPETPRGENILALFKMKGLFALSAVELQSLACYYDEYLELKKQYGAGDE